MMSEKDMIDKLHIEGEPVRPTPEQVIREERDQFLTIIALQTNQALQAPELPGEVPGKRKELRQQVLDAFIKNFERFTSADQPIERLMALQFVSETVLNGVDADIKEQYMTRVAMIDINAPVVTSMAEVPPSTAELDAMVTNVTDEAVSPPRGMAIERMQVAMQKARAFVVNKVVAH